MATQIVNISLPADLVKKIDTAAKANYATRSEFIRQTVVNRLRSQDTDVWGALEAGADEVRTKAEQSGYRSDNDIVRAVKEVRQTKSNAKRQ
jgi:metal-responsive CopG/Arc/MetJ family transcriptional regulator